ncbi:MAG: hypothetical protein JXB24_05050 [Bacteroidales bacterium]|nr:hypothetical protein [Bacteroidales bacterium]
MSIHFKRFLLKNTIATLAIFLTGLLLFTTCLSEYFHFFYPVLVLVTFAVNLIVFYIVTKKKGGSDNSMYVVVKSFAIKFFSYSILALVFLLFVKTPELKITYVILLFSLYIVFTFLEITSLLRFFKTEKE